MRPVEFNSNSEVSSNLCITNLKNYINIPSMPSSSTRMMDCREDEPIRLTRMSKLESVPIEKATINRQKLVQKYEE